MLNDDVPEVTSAVHIVELSNIISNGFIYLSACPICLLFNDPSHAKKGKCAHCGYDINKDVSNILSQGGGHGMERKKDSRVHK